MKIQELSQILRCPRCKSPLYKTEKYYNCQNTECIFNQKLYFPIVNKTPVLVDFNQSILSEKETLDSLGAAPIKRKSKNSLKSEIGKFLFPQNEIAKTNAINLKKYLKGNSNKPSILIIGGGSKGEGTEELYSDPSIQIIGFDIYSSSLTHFIADAHHIPLADWSVDAVWIQAVLEHVLNPWQVAEEIYRVLKSEGIVYAETPFMQPVHEGAYDFTRFTESGHRWLFKKFQEIDSGVVLGPSAQLLKSIEHIFRGLFHSHLAGLISKSLLFWIKYLDRLIPESYALDNASAVFFLGQKSSLEMQPKDMIGYYKGANPRKN